MVQPPTGLVMRECTGPHDERGKPEAADARIRTTLQAVTL
jgi:hypothetical protein